jgi:hypothetical protein
MIGRMIAAPELLLKLPEMRETLYLDPLAVEVCRREIPPAFCRSVIHHRLNPEAILAKERSRYRRVHKLAAAVHRMFLAVLVRAHCSLVSHTSLEIIIRHKTAMRNKN